MSAEPAAWGHARIPRASPPSARSACLAALVLIALIAGACVAAAVSGPTHPAPALTARDNYLSQPLMPQTLTPVAKPRQP